jgi:hypothetical protein
VRWWKRAVSLEAISEQLGRKRIVQVGTVYGPLTPTIDERQEEAAR